MAKFWRLPAGVTNLMFVFGLAALWLVFAPIQAGGQTAYVIVNGNSMEPGFHLGDLVIVRVAPFYAVGDVVTYQDRRMDAHVIHRIIGIEQDRYILKGDNNFWTDAYQPTRAEVIGKLWLYLPKLGRAIQWLRLPINIALTIGLLGGMLMTSLMIRPRKNKNKPGGNSAGVFEIAIYPLGILALACLALLAFSLSRPLKRNADPVPYQQSGAFFYSAAGSPRVYDTGSARSGEPVFSKLTCELNLGFVYTLSGEHLESISGQQQLIAQVFDEHSGWQRTIPLSSATNFYGASDTNLATLNLCQLEALVADVEKETGFRSNSYTLTIKAQVSTTGKLAGQKLNTTFEPQLVFKFDSLHFYLASSNSQTDPLKTITSDSLSNSASVENTLPLPGIKPTVRTVRVLSVTGLLLALGGLLILGWQFYVSSTRSPEEMIRLKYGSLLVEVCDIEPQTTSMVINVPTIAELAKVANKLNLMILSMPRDHRHYYFVQNSGTAYRYTIEKNEKLEM